MDPNYYLACMLLVLVMGGVSAVNDRQVTAVMNCDNPYFCYYAYGECDANHYLGDTHAYAFNCHMYCVCHAWGWILQLCPQKYVWNQNHQQCEDSNLCQQFECPEFSTDQTTINGSLISSVQWYRDNTTASTSSSTNTLLIVALALLFVLLLVSICTCLCCWCCGSCCQRREKPQNSGGGDSENIDNGPSTDYDTVEENTNSYPPVYAEIPHDMNCSYRPPQGGITTAEPYPCPTYQAVHAPQPSQRVMRNVTPQRDAHAPVQHTTAQPTQNASRQLNGYPQSMTTSRNAPYNQMSIYSVPPAGQQHVIEIPLASGVVDSGYARVHLKPQIDTSTTAATTTASSHSRTRPSSYQEMMSMDEFQNKDY